MSERAQTVLVTARLRLRSWRPDDAALLRTLWSERDPRVPHHRRLSQDGRPTITELAERIRREDPGPRMGLLAIVPNGAVEPVGYCGLVAHTEGRDDEPAIAYELLVRAQGRGYATEAGQAVLDWARACGYPRLWATVRAWNAPSCRVMSKLGFRRTARIDHDPVHGDSLHFTRVL